MSGKKIVKPGSIQNKIPPNLQKSEPKKAQTEKISHNSEHVIAEKITKKPPVFPLKFEIDVIRPRDLLVLHFSFKNLKRLTESETGKVTLVPVKPTDDAYIIVTFPPQSIEEEALFEVADPEPLPVQLPDSDTGKPSEDPTDGTPTEPPTPPMRSKLSGTSRLVFKLPKDAEPIEFTIEGLLSALKELPLVVASTAKPPEVEEPVPGWKIKPGLRDKIKAKWDFEKYSNVAVAKKTGTVAAQIAQNRSAIAQAQARFHAEKVGFVTEIHKFDEWNISEKIPGVLEALLPKLNPPTDLETAIEAPFRLILSPNRHAAWVHAINEVKSVRQQFFASSAFQFQSEFAALSQQSVLFDNITEAIFDPDDIQGSNAAAINMHADMQLIQKEISKIDPKLTGKVKFKVKETDWVELWHTRLATRNTDSSVTEDPFNPLKSVRAIWSKDAGFLRHHLSQNMDDAPKPYPNDASDNPYRTPLDSADRYNFVHLSANYRLKIPRTNISYKPRAIPTRQMMLTSLGSWLNLRGAWDPTPQGLEVEEWRHISTLARDHYVRVVYRGFLFPFGHRASLIKITERKFHNKLKGNPAYLRQRMFIVVREPEKSYVPMEVADPDGRKYDLAFPFTRVRITTLVTPLLAPPEDSDIGEKSRQLFRPIEGSTGKEVRFHVIATDLDGREVEFSTPMNFVGKAINDFNYGTEANRETAFNLMKMTQWDFTGIKPDGLGSSPPKNGPAEPADLTGQQVCYAPSQIQGDTALNTENIWFGAQIPEWEAFTKLQEIYSLDIPRFYPRLEFASAKIPAIKHLARNEGVAKFNYLITFLKKGFGPGNEGEVFVQLVDSTLGLDFSSQGQRSGGLLTPNMQINGLSRLHGPVGGALDDLSSMTSNTFDPETFFAGMMPKLFGAIDLWTIIDAIGGPPQFISQALSPMQSISDSITTLYEQLEGLGTAADDLRTALFDAVECISDLLVSPGGSWSNLETALNDVKSKIPPVLDALNQTDVSASVRIPIETALTSLDETLGTVADLIPTLQTAMDLLTEQKITLHWDTPLISWPEESSTLGPIFDSHGGNAKLYLHAEIDAKSTNSGGPVFMMSCGLKDFSLNLIGNKTITKFIYLNFDKIEFVMGSSQKADVNVEFGGIEFVGVLSFVEALKFLIPLDGFSDPPGLEITEEGITASLSLALPNLTFGVFSLTNMSLAAGFSVPFIGDPLSVWFGFCTRDNPFCLTVAMFGGGGFFSITLQPNGLKCLEASFEFGANLTLDVGVASGGIYAMAGIYFKMELNSTTGDLDATLTGYFRMGGFLSVLGIISISIELYLELTYESATGKCTGRATLTIEVEVLFFSVSVEITAEREFSGSNGDPTFAELMAPYPDPFDGHEVDPWLVYCEAFA